MVHMLDSKLGISGFSHGRSHGVVFMDKTLPSHNASLLPGVSIQWILANLMQLKDNRAMD